MKASLPLVSSLITQLAFANSPITFQNTSNTILRVDTGSYGPAIEEAHYFYQDWPVGFAVSSKGRIFVSYYPGNVSFTLGEVVNSTAEKAYLPQYNVPSANSTQTIDGTLFGSQNSTGFISVQALYVTPKTANRSETLWVLDTGRPNDASQMAYGLPGGAKLVAVNLDNDTIVRTYLFPSTVSYPDSSVNDMRFDFRENITTSGQGVAYLSDESPEGRNGIIVLDLGTGESWRHLDRHPAGLSGYGVVPSYQGMPFYQETPTGPFTHLPQGLDGIQLDLTGSTLFFSSMTSDYLFSIETKYLLDHTSPACIQAANSAVRNLGQRGGNGNGFEGDSNGFIYQAMPEQNAVYAYDPTTLRVAPFIRDPRIIWPDGLSVSEDGYIYIIINQLPYQPMWNNGTDLRQKPGALLRAKLPNNGTKVKTLF
ncbi:major royal jelly protein [Metarhizium robertsii]|uniref:Major royal jelly protein n=2 Tax=Metarhizium robertsii TaxID=568076 RepID=E9ELH9_METRA|nr:major royal jelly protein [Metarhizium robertsii ARSEF 23]EFZ03957.1 major royal jelly protein [Metarhizium robertsii ARSEF 23]EXU99073.1 major royal jelly protein [Metarhizium robertsii]